MSQVLLVCLKVFFFFFLQNLWSPLNQWLFSKSLLPRSTHKLIIKSLKYICTFTYFFSLIVLFCRFQTKNKFYGFRRSLVNVPYNLQKSNFTPPSQTFIITFSLLNYILSTNIHIPWFQILYPNHAHKNRFIIHITKDCKTHSLQGKLALTGCIFLMRSEIVQSRIERFNPFLSLLDSGTPCFGVSSQCIYKYIWVSWKSLNT